jgi:hypothetical protein
MTQRVTVHRRECIVVPAPGGRRGSIVVGALWMFLISLLLFWLPVIGPLLAGIVGGKRAGGVGAAIAAVFVGILLFVLFTAVGLPLVGVLTGGLAFLTVATMMIGPLLIGAIIGGALA